MSATTLPAAYRELLPSLRMRIDNAVIEGDLPGAIRLYRRTVRCDWPSARRAIAALDRCIWEIDLGDEDGDALLDWDF